MKFDQQHIREKVIGGIGRGLTQSLAAQSVGISSRTLEAWITKGRRGHSPAYVAFFEDIKAAEATSAGWALEVIKDAALGRGRFLEVGPDWKPAAWYLERRHRYTRPASFVMAPAGVGDGSGDDDATTAGDVVAELAKLPPRVLEQALQLALAAGQPPGEAK